MTKIVPPPKLLPVLQKLKTIYLQWFIFYTALPKTHRYTLGSRIDLLFIEMIESTATAGYLNPSEKLPYIRLSIKKLDTVKILVMILWETKSLDNKRYIALSAPLEEIGKMFGGWHGQIVKQNSPEKFSREK